MITVTSTHKPAQAVATATARVQTTETYVQQDIIDAGLAALGETSSSLFGWGIEGHRTRAEAPLPAGTYTVFAHRD